MARVGGHGALLCAVVTLALVLGGSASEYPSPPADCVRYEKCNGEMCAMICEVGTVVVDEWATAALSFQRRLQHNRSVLFYEVPSTHNGAIVQDYGMGIEEEFLTNYLAKAFPDDNKVVIANQKHGLFDQLRMGVRHIEVDIYHMERLGGIKVCHWPVCPPDLLLLVRRVADEQGTDPPEWDCGNLGCDENKPFLADVLQEVVQFLAQPENDDEFVTLYIDNKNIRNDDEAAELVDVFVSTFGDAIFTPADKAAHYPTRWPTVRELLDTGKRVLLEIRTEALLDNELVNSVIFNPSLWTYQFGVDQFEPAPACLVKGDFTFGSAMTRSLDSSLVLGPLSWWGSIDYYPGELIANMSACSVTAQSLDQLHPATMKYFVWSWAVDQPDGRYACTATDASGRWMSQPCERVLRHACVAADNELDWTLSPDAAEWGQASCPPGYVFARPEVGYHNTLLAAAAAGESVWLNHLE